LHDVGHDIAEPVSDVIDAILPASILASIMQECADSLVFIGAVFKGDAGDSEEMGQIGNGRAFTFLASVDIRGVVQGLVKAR
jgi:hypothetical protein